MTEWGQPMTRESGFGSLKAILAVAIFVALVYLGIKLVPPFINNYQFQEELNSVARVSTYAQGATEENVRNDILGKAKDLGLPVKEEQITVSKTNIGVNIDVKYNVAVAVPGYTFNLKFNPTAGNKMITAK